MNIPTQKYKGDCRQKHTIHIPCNWNINGMCGIDTKKCLIKNIRKETKDQED